MFKRIAFLTAIVLMAIPAWAVYFNVGNYKYYTTGANTCIVDGFSPSATTSAMSVVNFPGRVTYNGTTYSVEHIGSWAFSGNLNIEEVNIPYGVTEIEDCAFEGCTNLDVVRMPSSLNLLQGDCFKNCTGNLYIYTAASTPPECIDDPFPGAVLSRLNVRRDDPAIITKFKNATYWKRFSQIYSTANVYDISYGSGTKVGYYVIESGLAKLVGGGTTCNVASSVVVNGTTYQVREIGGYSFSSSGSVNGGITKITGTDNIETIGAGAFKGSSLTTASFAKVKYINPEAFMNCTSLSSVSLGESYERLLNFGSKSFYKCTALTSITFPYNNDVYSHNYYISFGDYAFAYSGLTKLILPRVTRTIGQYAFAHSPIQYVYIYSGGNTSAYSFEGTAFYNINSGSAKYLHVPYASLSYYRNLWSGYFTNTTGDLDKITINGVDISSNSDINVSGVSVDFSRTSITLNGVAHKDQSTTFIKSTCQHLKIYCNGVSVVNSQCAIEAKRPFTGAYADVTVFGDTNSTLWSYGVGKYTFDFHDGGNFTIKDFPNFVAVNKNCAVYYGTPASSVFTINNCSGSFTRQNKTEDVIAGFKKLTLVDTDFTNCTYSPYATYYGRGTGLVTFRSTLAAELVGDLDGNGLLEVNDVVILADIAMGGSMNGVSLTVADVDGNGKIEVNDVVMLAGTVIGS
ncbi:MAG: leucine-rich repeat protein [Muribaculaceae bacterium]|nr:leucine-rich repeat protein [Muribaculaceae bacterium]